MSAQLLEANARAEMSDHIGREIANGCLTSALETITESIEPTLIARWCEQNIYDECEIGRLVKDHYLAIKESVVEDLL